MLEHKDREKKAYQHKVFFHGTLDFYFYFVDLMVEDFLLNLTMQYWKKKPGKNPSVLLCGALFYLHICVWVCVCVHACVEPDVHESFCSLLRLPPNGGQGT